MVDLWAARALADRADIRRTRLDPVTDRDISTGVARDTGELKLLAAQSSLSDRGACRPSRQTRGITPRPLPGALGVSWIKASASVTSGHTNRAALLHGSVVGGEEWTV